MIQKAAYETKHTKTTKDPTFEYNEPDQKQEKSN